MLFSKFNNPKMEEVRAYISVSTASDFDSVATHIANAERDYLLPLIGESLYYRLRTFYYTQHNDALTQEEQKTSELLHLAQSSVIHLAYWLGFDLLNAHISDGGFKRTESTSVKGLYKYQEDNLKNYFRSNGLNSLDTLLLYLENNIESFGEFSSSPAFTLFKSNFIPTTAIFDKILFINNSRLTFLRLASHLQLIEDTEIAPVLGAAALLHIKSEMIKPIPSDTVLAIIPHIRKPLAYLASALLMEESGADLTDTGLYFTSNKAIYVSPSEHKPSDADRIALLVMRNRNFGFAFLAQLRTYLSANAVDWPTVPTSSGTIFRRDNTTKKTFWQ